MNRFKFRAWIKEQYEHDNTDIPYRMVYLDTAEDWWVIEGRTGEPMHGEGGTVTDYPYYVMQWTGKKDTAGVDVYEGDIIKYTDYMGENEEICFAPIVWKEKQAQLFPDVIDMFWPLDMVVVGNVYENPELLEEE